MRHSLVPAAIVVLLLSFPAPWLVGHAQTFRSSLDLVSVAVVVRDAGGRLVTDLKPQDFEVLDDGRPRAIAQFRYGDDGDARVALLVDGSGSMVVGSRRDRSRMAADFLGAGLRPADGATVFSFDKRLRRLTPYTSDQARLRDAVGAVAAFGSTSLYDAVVQTVGVVADEQPRARAVVVVTDGLDTASAHTAGDAAAAAARLDLPVYVLGVAADQASATSAEARAASIELADIARRTGGVASPATSPAEISSATRAILAELRAQYLLALPAASEPGWHGLQVRVRRGRIQARSRDGYLVP